LGIEESSGIFRVLVSKKSEEKKKKRKKKKKNNKKKKKKKEKGFDHLIKILQVKVDSQAQSPAKERVKRKNMPPKIDFL